MKDLYSESNRASYSPEDNKIRLYIGRVPRDEYEQLRADGWTSTPKQSCDFVATWTPSRRDTALAYAGIIEDEDQSPQDRAADRAERFGDYRDKRTSEATGHADSYDAGPSAHGYQSQARAERSAYRHDRIASRACDAWSKAEYWQHRTAGVISHALHKALPGVRMGRIKVLEAELRKAEADIQKRKARFADWQTIAAVADPEKQTAKALHYAGRYDQGWSRYPHPRASELPDGHPPRSNETSLYYLLSDETHPITGAEACALFFASHSQPADETDWTTHYRLRLAYENQMLEAQGGRLEQCEVLPGGKFAGKLILRVNKSSATGRATSVSILGDKVDGWTYKASNISGTQWAEHSFDLERYAPDAYTPPTPESLAELARVKAAIKAAAPKSEPCPLINPTDADAERLQALWNERAKAANDSCETKTIQRVTQAVYSANSKGTFARAETRGLCRDGELENNPNWNMYSKERNERAKRIGSPVCKVRISGFDPYCVIVLTDKPQKPLPAAVWEVPAPVHTPELVNA